jgi:hypothetical protein
MEVRTSDVYHVLVKRPGQIYDDAAKCHALRPKLEEI